MLWDVKEIVKKGSEQLIAIWEPKMRFYEKIFRLVLNFFLDLEAKNLDTSFNKFKLRYSE